MEQKIKIMIKSIANKYGKTYEDKQDIESLCYLKLLELKDRQEYSYLNKSFVNEALKFIAKNKPLPMREEKSYTLDSYLDYLVLEEQLKELSDKDKSIITWLIEGYTYDDISKELDMTPNNLAVYIHRHKSKWQSLVK